MRVTVDLADGPGEVDLDTLAPVSQAVSQALDEADPIKGQYTLEVTSPGAERPLATARQFRRATGRRAEVTAGEQTVTGTVLGADDDHVTLEVDRDERRVALADVTRARMVLPDITPRP